MAVLGPRLRARALSSRGKRGPLLIAARGPLTIAVSLPAERRLQTRRLSNCGSQAQPLHGTWDPPRPGLEPVSPAPAGRPPTTAPPGKPYFIYFYKVFKKGQEAWKARDKYKSTGRSGCVHHLWDYILSFLGGYHSLATHISPWKLSICLSVYLSITTLTTSPSLGTGDWFMSRHRCQVG